jgi:putative ABC transport system permease protein
MPGCGEYDECVVVPRVTLLELAPNLPLAFLAYQVENENVVRSAATAMRYRLRRMLALSSFDRDPFQVHQAADVIERIEREVNTGSAIIMGIVCLTLLVGGIGVMNIMLVTVVERTPEIGLRKAVGARSREILMQFLVESSFLCTGGGLVGTGLGVALAWALIDLVAPGLTPVLPARLIFTSIGFAVLTGVLFGFTPALKAAKLSPMEALRRD